MPVTDQRQTLRLIQHLPCALRAKPDSHKGQPATAAEPAATDQLESLAKEFESYCEQISDRATQNALRCLHRQLDHLQSTVTTNLVQQAAWTQDPQTRRVSLSFDALEVELLPSDQLLVQPKFVDVIFDLPGIPSIVCTLQVTSFTTDRVVGTFQQISDADLRKLRRYVLVQDAASNQRLG